MTEQYSEQLLDLVAREAQRALATTDPIERAQIIALLVQPYAGWALHFSVADVRATGASWQAIAGALGQAQHSTVQRQFTARGPVVTVRPFHSENSRNRSQDGQDAVRLAMTALVHNMFPTTELQGSKTGRRLYIPVQAMAQAMTAPAAQPLLTTVGHVLDVADDMTRHEGYPAAAGFAQERAAWETLAELRAVFERDRTLIEVADAARRAAERADTQAG